MHFPAPFLFGLSKNGLAFVAAKFQPAKAAAARPAPHAQNGERVSWVGPIGALIP
jgi:hypothetical protein